MIRTISIQTKNGLIEFPLETHKAFGSGVHESTSSCLQKITELPEYYKTKPFLDVGCGTGILAIAASKLGFSRVIAFDTNFQACQTAQKNMLLHGPAISLFCGPVQSLKNQTYGTIMANLQGDIVLHLVDEMVLLLDRKGLLCVAGIAWEWVFDVKTSFLKNGLQLVKIDFNQEFATLLLTK